MAPPSRSSSRSRLPWVQSAPWAAAFAVLGFGLFVLVRACAYETAPVFAYTAYFGLHVALPGLVALHAINRGPVSLTMALALGVPTGYAIEIFSFLALAAMDVRDAMTWLPLLWASAGALRCLRRREWPLRCRWTLRHGGLALAMSGLFLCTVASVTTQMFAESPLVLGLPQRPIFHDWMYLVGRAAAIKHHWPLEDPSLAGTPLQYHYFMLVHAASASLVTKLEVMQVLLRFTLVPLGAVLVVQAYTLGRLVSRSPWGGVLAAFLTVAVSELSFSPNYGDPEFLGLFIRWLFVSPTFYFGTVFFGALLLAVALAWEAGSLGGRHLAWLALLAAAGTGAKGTMTPVVLAALGLWFGWSWWRTRRFPRRIAVIGLTLGGGFLAIYVAILSSWGTGQAAFEPFRILQVTGFWKAHFGNLQRVLAGWLPAAMAAPIALAACGAIVFAGTAGVRLLALAQLAQRDRRARRELGPWLTAAFLSAAAMGLTIRLHANSELYFVLLVTLPMAVLTAAFMVSAVREWQQSKAAIAAGGRRSLPPWRRLARTAAIALAAGGIGLTTAVQCGLWVARQKMGFAEWLRQYPQMRAREEMRTLRDTMLWIRQWTERDAILVANAFTPGHYQRGRGDAVDYTTVGVHFYYSALSERRLYVEGPTYAHDPGRARERMQNAAGIFFENRVPLTLLPGNAPAYAVIDRSLNDGARIALPEKHRVFTNRRFDIYRLPRRLASSGDHAAVASLSP